MFLKKKYNPPLLDVIISESPVMLPYSQETTGDVIPPEQKGDWTDEAKGSGYEPWGVDWCTDDEENF